MGQACNLPRRSVVERCWCTKVSNMSWIEKVRRTRSGGAIGMSNTAVEQELSRRRLGRANQQFASHTSTRIRRKRFRHRRSKIASRIAKWRTVTYSKRRNKLFSLNRIQLCNNHSSHKINFPSTILISIYLFLRSYTHLEDPGESRQQPEAVPEGAGVCSVAERPWNAASRRPQIRHIVSRAETSCVALQQCPKVRMQSWSHDNRQQLHASSTA